MLFVGGTQIAPNKTSIELYYQTPATGANYHTNGTNNVLNAIIK